VDHGDLLLREGAGLPGEALEKLLELCLAQLEGLEFAEIVGRVWHVVAG